LILNAFEQVSGLKINFHKSELFCFGDAWDALRTIRKIFGCMQGELSMCYLGILIHYKRIKDMD
jgi:hypothetical protein